MLRVCILTETYHPEVGGGETQARTLAEGLVSRGFSAIVLTRRSRPSSQKTEVLGGVAVHRLPPVGSGHFKKWGLLLTSLSALIRLRHQYDLIFVSGFRVIGFSAVGAGKLLGKPCILKADSLGELSGEFFADGLATLHLKPSSLLFKAFLSLRNRVLKQADGFVAMSSAVGDELLHHGVRPVVIQTIPNSVDTSRFRPAGECEKHTLRGKLGLPLHGKAVTFTGRLVSYKGLPLLLQVWRDIHHKYGDATLILSGSGGLDMHDCEAELRHYVRANHLQDSVRFAGNVRNVHEYLQASDIFVFPTENEAFGIALIEAMACGLPVITTAVGGVKDIVQHGENGLVVQAGDFGQLYGALDTLLADAALAARLGEAARRTAQDQYSQEWVTRQYVELFERVAIGATRPPRWALWGSWR